MVGGKNAGAQVKDEHRSGDNSPGIIPRRRRIEKLGPILAADLAPLAPHSRFGTSIGVLLDLVGLLNDALSAHDWLPRGALPLDRKVA